MTLHFKVEPRLFKLHLATTREISSSYSVCEMTSSASSCCRQFFARWELPGLEPIFPNSIRKFVFNVSFQRGALRWIERAFWLRLVLLPMIVKTPLSVGTIAVLR